MALLDEPHDLIRDGLLAPPGGVGEFVHGPSAGGVLDEGEDVGGERVHVATVCANVGTAVQADGKGRQ